MRDQHSVTEESRSLDSLSHRNTFPRINLEYGSQQRQSQQANSNQSRSINNTVEDQRRENAAPNARAKSASKEASSKHNSSKSNESGDEERSDIDSHHHSHDGPCSGPDSSCSSSEFDDSQGSDQEDPEQEIQTFLKNYYDDNYAHHEVNMIDDYIHQKVWNVYFDQNYESVYIFVAQVKVIQGQQAPNQMAFNRRNITNPDPRAWQQLGSHLNNLIKNKIGQFEQKEYAKEFEALSLYSKCDVELRLVMQTWTLDDRIIKDTNDTTEALIRENQIIQSTESFSFDVNKFQIMNYLRNKYQDYAQIIMNHKMIYFFVDFQNIKCYDTEKNIYRSNSFKVLDNPNRNVFQISEQYSKEQKDGFIDDIVIFNFRQIPKEETAEHGHGHENHPPSNNKQIHKKPGSLCSSKFTQSLQLQSIQLEKIVDLKTETNVVPPILHNQGGQDGGHEDGHGHGHGHDAVAQSLHIKDDQILNYYEMGLEYRQLSKIFIQQIGEESYIILFPTGLLMIIFLNPLVIQSKMALGLKKDENLIDYSYQISLDGQYHCIWMIDQKQQVWKCFMENNPNQGNWSLVRVTTLNNLNQKCFFQQATNYDGFNMVNSLNQIQGIRQLNFDKLQSMEYMQAFNPSATKMIIILQPDIRKSNGRDPSKESVVVDTASKYLEENLGIDISQITNNKIRIFAIMKNQNIILNKIININNRYGTEEALNTEISMSELPDNKDQNSPAPNLEIENEILELIYMGKIPFERENQRKEYRQFMVARKHNLEILYTDGTVYWVEKIKDSHVKKPYTIQDILQSQTNKTVIVYCSIPGDDADCFIKVFTYNKKHNKFVFQKKPMEKISQNNLSKSLNKSVMLNSNGELVSMNVVFVNTKIKKEFLWENISCAKIGPLFQITLPKGIIFKELINEDNQLERFIMSGDGRLLMCDRIVIQMNQNQNNVKDIGCIIYERDHSNINYRFLSLLQLQSREQIHKLLKKPATYNQILSFNYDRPPIFSPFFIDYIYFTNHLEEISAQNGTSIIKMSTNSMKCVEIYQSKFQIIHFSINENKELSKFKASLAQKGNVRKDQLEVQRLSESSFAQKQQTIQLNKSISRRSTKQKKQEQKDEQIAFDDQQIHHEGGEIQYEGGSNKHKCTGKHHHNKKNKTHDSISINQNDFMYGGTETINNPNNTLIRPQITLQQVQTNSIDLKNQLNIQGNNSQVHNLQEQLKRSIQLMTEQFQKGTQELVNEELSLNSNFLSLLSQSKNQINIEIIQDNNLMTKGLHSVSSKQPKKKEKEEENENTDDRAICRATLFYYVSVLSKQEFFVDSEVGWISDHNLILTLNNRLYLMNLNHTDLCPVGNNIHYGKQQVNMGLYVSIVRWKQDDPNAQAQDIINIIGDDKFKLNSKDSNMKSKQVAASNEEKEQQEIKKEGRQVQTKQIIEAELKKRDRLYKAQECILKMSITSLVRYASIMKLSHSTYIKDFDKLLYFFIPCEELKGSSIFTLLSANYNVIQKYVEKIDAPFIEYLNQRIRSINYYVIKYKSSNQYIANQHLTNIQQHQQSPQVDKSDPSKQQIMQFLQHSLSVHMYQHNISGINAIDNAFQKNSIFSIKAFVDSMLDLKEDKQFRNCFDQALLKMIRKGMNVKELCNSGLLFPQIWQNYTLFSHSEKQVVIGYNNHMEDLEFDDPTMVFNETASPNQTNKKIKMKGHKKKKQSKSVEVSEDEEDDQLEKPDQCKEASEQYEMQYNYIFLQEIQTENKIAFTKTLKESQDLTLFEIEVIQTIIDYKWNKYARNFFMFKFWLYLSFLITYISDLESINKTEIDSDLRIKDWEFYLKKAWCGSIQFTLLTYEIMQFRKEGSEYFSSFWNYFELTGICSFAAATIMDLCSDTVSDSCRIIYCCSMLFTLVKMLFLIRIFKSLSFLTMMIIQVVIELGPFLVLFTLFIITFSECYSILGTDISAYGRLHPLFAYFIQTLRSAFGDFSVIDPYQGFDQYDEKYDPEIHDEIIYKHGRWRIYFTFVVFILCNFSLFMIFMNFIIAVISDSYSKVRDFAVAHDYKQRVLMTYEREIQFGDEDFQNENYFPNILIIRKKKTQALNEVTNSSGQLKFIRNSFKEFQQQSQTSLDNKIKEQKQHFATSLQFLELDIKQVSNDMQKLIQQNEQKKRRPSHQDSLLDLMPAPRSSQGRRTINEQQEEIKQTGEQKLELVKSRRISSESTGLINSRQDGGKERQKRNAITGSQQAKVNNLLIQTSDAGDEEPSPLFQKEKRRPLKSLDEGMKRVTSEVLELREDFKQMKEENTKMRQLIQELIQIQLKSPRMNDQSSQQPRLEESQIVASEQENVVINTNALMKNINNLLHQTPMNSTSAMRQSDRQFHSVTGQKEVDHPERPIASRNFRPQYRGSGSIALNNIQEDRSQSQD